MLIVDQSGCRILDDIHTDERLHHAILPNDTTPFVRSESADASIRIDDPDFLSILQSKLPPIEDPQFLYFDDAIVCAYTRIKEDSVVLDDVWSVTVLRDGKLIKVLDGGRRVG
jgi:hypothetical protein